MPPFKWNSHKLQGIFWKRLNSVVHEAITMNGLPLFQYFLICDWIWPTVWLEMFLEEWNLGLRCGFSCEACCFVFLFC